MVSRALDGQMLRLVEHQQHLALAQIESQIAQDPVDRTHSDGPQLSATRFIRSSERIP
jgi:hypothetical protein